MTTQHVEATQRPISGHTARYLVSAAVVAALTGTAWPQQAAAADADDLAEVTVTGSRIARSRDLEAPSPIVTIDKDLFEKSSAAGLEVVLNQQPQFVPQSTQFTSGVQGSPTFTPGAVTLNLRGLGPNRNLVLVDGRRGQPGNATLAVDINTIPKLAIQGVETITGGASAVYGPDAMAGVVNFVLRKNFQGLDFDVQRGQTSHGDGAETRASALIGMNGADNRGNMMVGLEWAKRDAVFQADRKFYTDGWLDPNNPSGGFIVPPEFAPAGNPPSQAALDSLFPQAAPGTVGPGSTIYFNADNTPFIQGHNGLGYNGPLNSLAPGRYQGIKVLGSGTGTSAGNLDQVSTEGFASIPLERHSLFARGSFNLTDSLSSYAQLSYNTSDVLTRSFGYPPAVTIWQASIPRYNSATPGSPQDSTWLPPALLTLLNSRSNPDANWSLYQLMDYTGFEVAKNTTDVWQGLAGLQGTLPFRDWTWDAYVSRGNTHVQQDFTGMNSLQRYQYLVGLPNFGKGATNASPPGTPFGYGVTCTSGLPVFQQFEVSQDCVDSIASPLKNETQLRQDIVEGNLQGALMNLPAGEARFSFGAAYRSEKFSYSPGYPVGAITDNPIGLFASAYTKGDINVKEAYTEFLVPVLKRLDLELGYRYSDFNTAGGTNTYKALFTWKALDSVSFRGGFQAATRAPNVAELFQGPTQAVVAFPQEDPCSSSTLAPWGNVASNPNRAKVQQLCRELIGNSTSEFDTQTFNTPNGPDGWTRQTPKFFPLEIEVQTGNPKVLPETGRTWTFGTVLTEPFGVNKLVATLDAYRVKISDTISPQSSISTYNNCFNFDGQSNPTYDVTNPNCQLIQRNPVTGDRATVTALYSNLGTLLTQGLDLTVNWAHPMGPGEIRFDTSINYVNKFEYQTSPTSPVVDAKGTLDPIPASGGVTGGIFTYKTFTHVGYAWNALSVGLGWQHLPSIRAAAAATNPATTIQGASSYDLLFLSAGYSYDKYSVRVGIDNLLDKQPPTVQSNPGVTTASNVTNPGYYDVLGRRYYVGVKASF